MAGQGRPGRPRSKSPVDDKDAPHAAAQGDALSLQDKRKHHRDRVRSSADKLGLKPLPEKPSTKDLLMDVGEVVIGRQGVEGVTLREIGLLAGQSNSNVVQYHFENKDGLIAAILENRVRRREIMRSEQLDALREAGLDSDPRKLLEILWLPALSFQDEHGNHSFCRFLLQCRLHSEFSIRFSHDERYEGSVLVEIMKAFRKNYPDLPKDVFSQRLSTLTLMFVASVIEFDNLRQIKNHDLKFDHRPVIDMAIAALSAPHRKYS